ncbi:methyl-accepting chemotaxis protein [Sporosarcina sp. 179-K 3D1 HS]|uniref:methyl-accepting chemotaxis protein n=1 Tax=Sporosarcina sp. 179-K 3D1 HS TaxID=3232169 RepID=UPI0039A2E88E
MKMSVRNKLVSLSVIVILFPILFVGLMNYFVAKKELDQVGRIGLQNGTYAVLDLIEELDTEVKSGSLTLEEAQEKARIRIVGPKGEEGKRAITNRAKYGENFYFFAVTEEGIIEAHPSLDGVNVIDFQTDDGRYFIQESITEAKKPNGGFVRYDWPTPTNPDVKAPKITYSLQDPHWGWIIAAGTYEMDFNAGAVNVLKNSAIMMLIATLIGVGLFWIFSGRMTSYIKRIMAMTSDIAKGRLTGEDIPILSRDELGILATNVNEMKSSLNEMVGHTRESSNRMRNSSEMLSAITEETTASADEVHHAIAEISNGAVVQAEEAETAIGKVDNLSELISNTTEKYEEIVGGMTTMTNLQIAGSEKVGELERNSEEFTEVIHELRKNFSQLTDGMGEIQAIVQTITSISEQTNLLALNASIEAARAGEHGKGFAVVADEVRKLSEDTNEATNRVRDLLVRIEGDTASSENQMTHTLKLSQVQVEAINEAKQAFDHLSDSIQGITGHLQSLDSDMQEMDANRLVVVGAINQIASVATESAAATEEVNASIDEQKTAITSIMHSSLELQTEAERMHELVERFT